MYRWGCQTPNGEPFNAGDMVDTFGDGFYVIMQGELNRLPELRKLAPKAFIMLRFYLPNWFITLPAMWANQIRGILNQVNASDEHGRRNRDLIDGYTWANEQNLKAESGGILGSSPGDMIKPGQYAVILKWNTEFLDAVDTSDIKDVPRIFPALAMGNSDDQDDGAGVGLEILQPVIVRCQYGAIHPYWSADKPLDDEWSGLGRIHKQLPFFRSVPVLVTETGNFAVDRPTAPDQYVNAGYYMQGIDQILGFAYFIWSDPTKSHQGNDMSRNPAIAAALKLATKTERPVGWVPPAETPTQPTPTLEVPPVANPPPQTTARKLSVGYQVWQWSGVRTVGNYADLLGAMNAVGATVLSDKYSDSDVLQGRFDNDPLAVKSIQVMIDRKQWCADNGFEYIPWDVPRAIPVNGDPFEGAKQEALFHADVCNQVGLRRRISDLEFYPSFFGYSLNGTDYFGSMSKRNDAAELYYETFKNNSDTETICQPDPRQWGTIRFSALKKYWVAILWQSYAYWFQSLGDTREHWKIIQDSIDKAKQLEIPYGLCLYCDTGTAGDTPPELAAEIGNMALDQGAEYLHVYKAPVTARLNGVLLAISRRGGMSVDSGDIKSVIDEAWALSENASSNVATSYRKLAFKARALGYGWMGNGFDAAAMAIEGAALGAKAALKAPKE